MLASLKCHRAERGGERIEWILGANLINSQKGVLTLSVRLSVVSTYQCGSHWTDFREIRNFYKKIVEDLQIWLKFEKCRALYVKNFVLLYCWELYNIFIESKLCASNRLSSFHVNTQQLYIVDSYIQVDDNKNGKHCYVSTAEMVTLTRHDML
jgi:hypothetical protein